MLQLANERQEAFVANFVQGLDIQLAAKLAGYSATNGRVDTHQIMKQPAVVAAIHIEVARRMAVGAPLALNVLQEFVANPAMHPKIRLDSAKTLLSLAGHVAPKAKDATRAGDKPLNDMSTTELRALADKLEGELADRAKPVSSASAAPVATQAIEDII